MACVSRALVHPGAVKCTRCVESSCVIMVIVFWTFVHSNNLCVMNLDSL